MKHRKKAQKIYRLQRIALCFTLTMLVTSCRPMLVQTIDPAGPPEYKLGWQDGCDSGLSAEGGYSYKLLYGFKKRPEMAANDQYKQGWNEGFVYCRFALASSNQDHDFNDIGLGGGFQ